ncbi:MAG: DUF86 domain-containing protein [Thiotrichaceae bacterium]|nr:DUF86 domain-containing protein [Thiotrichaceae bacterium]
MLFLDDIIESTEKINNFIEKRDFEAFCNDEGIFDAVLMNLLIIGEATKKLPLEMTAAMPDVDWSGAAGLRDIIAHHYFGIDSNLVWDIVNNYVPAIQNAAIVLREQAEYVDDERK